MKSLKSLKKVLKKKKMVKTPLEEIIDPSQKPSPKLVQNKQG